MLQMLLYRYSWHSGDPVFVGSIVGWSLLIFAVASLAFLAARVLFALAAYHDAQSKNNTDAVMWALLIGFLGLIPGIIYLCVRESSGRTVCCQKCGFWHRAFEPNCPRCGEPNPQVSPAANPYRMLLESRAKKEVIAAAVCIGAAVLICIIGVSMIVANAAAMAEWIVTD